MEAEIKKLGNRVSNYSAAKVAAVARARPPQMKGKKPNPAGPKKNKAQFGPRKRLEMRPIWMLTAPQQGQMIIKTVEGREYPLLRQALRQAPWLGRTHHHQV